MPWLILSDGAGNREKPMKAEWSVRKDGSLLLGGWGKASSTLNQLSDKRQSFVIFSSSPATRSVTA